MRRTTLPSRMKTTPKRKKKTRARINGNERSTVRAVPPDRQFRLGRLQRLVLTAMAEMEKESRTVPLADLSRMVASVRGHVRRADRKKVHKNTFYRAVQGLCEKGYLKRTATSFEVRLLARGRKVVEERDLSWEEEIDLARRTERRLLRRQARWKREGKVVGG